MINRILGTSGHDFLIGSNEADQILGGQGNDLIFGMGGDDTIAGGTGDDVVDATGGNDVIQFARGDGQDRILWNPEFDLPRLDTLQFTWGITPTDIVLARIDDSLRLRVAGTSDQVLIENFFTTLNPIQRVIFANGTAWSASDLAAMVRVTTNDDDLLPLQADQGPVHVDGLHGNDSLTGSFGDDTLIGGGGNDSLNGFVGNDLLEGGDGNDSLYATNGHDTLIGGRGDDHLYLDASSAITYRFARGDGQDVLHPAQSTGAGPRVLEFVGDLTASDISAKRNGPDLILSIRGSSDRVTIQGFFWPLEGIESLRQVQSVQFSDGSTWDQATLLALSAQGTPGDDQLGGLPGYNDLRGGAGDDVLYLQGAEQTGLLDGGEGHDILRAGDGASTLSGGGGSDYLVGGTGFVTLDGGAGDDQIVMGRGANTYVFGAGHGHDRVLAVTGVSSDGHNLLTIQDYAPDDVRLRTEFGNLILSVPGTGDQFAIESYLETRSLQEIRFTDGTSWNLATIQQRLLVGTDGVDVIYGTDASEILSAGAGYYNGLSGLGGADTLQGGVGDDYLQGGDGDDLLQGADGTDTQFGNPGHDTLQGGAGDDILYDAEGDDSFDGGAGDDSIWDSAGTNVVDFGRGDGQDVLYITRNSGALDSSTLRFKDGIAAADVEVRQVGTHLQLRIAGTSDRVTVQDFFDHDNLVRADAGLRTVQFMNGTVWDAQMLQALGTSSPGVTTMVTGTTESDSLVGTDQDDQMDGLAGDDQMAGGANNDLLLGAEGNDTLEGNAGQDTLYGGASDDRLDGGDGMDRLFGGEGSNLLLGGAGNDLLYASGSQDTVDGGTGNDYIEATNGRTEIRFGFGDGVDDIVPHYNLDTSRFDTIRFKAGVRPEDVILTNAQDLLLVALAGSSDLLRIRKFFDFADASLANHDSHVRRFEFDDGTVWEHADILSRASQGSWRDDGMFGTNLADALQGGAGNDTFVNAAGNDTLDGGSGNDLYQDMQGENVVLFGRGDGHDRIQIPGGTDQVGINTIQFKPGIAPSDIEVRQYGSSLKLGIRGTSDQVEIIEFLDNFDVRSPKNPVQQVRFHDGTVWDRATLVTLWMGTGEGDDAVYGTQDGDTLSGQHGNDTLFGNGGGDSLSGGSGNDYLLGDAGDDLLLGNDGNDTLNGGPGQDTLEGGAGDDTLAGGTGDSVFRFGRGDGQDLIVARDGDEHRPDRMSTLEFKPGITAADVLVRQVQPTQAGWAPELELRIRNTSDRVRLSGVFVEAGQQGNLSPIQQVSFADGTLWTLEDLLARAFTATDGDDVWIDTNESHLLQSGHGNDAVRGEGGDDTLRGGTGNDTLIGGEGHDLLDGEAGDDRLEGGNGNDTLWGGAGSDTMLGGAGNDRYRVGIASDQVFENADEGIDTIEAAIPFTLGDHLDNLVLIGTGHHQAGGNALDNHLTGNSLNNLMEGFAGADTVLAGAGADTLLGGQGNDSLSGDDGNDRLEGGEGDDTLLGGAGSDTMLGGAGSDLYRVGLSSDQAIEEANEGTDTVEAHVSWTLGDNLEHLTLAGAAYLNGMGNALDNRIIGNSGYNVLTGQEGNDTLDGGIGADTLIGGAGDDTYHVNSSADVVVEDEVAGNDWVFSTARTFTLSAHIEGLALMAGASNGQGNAQANFLSGNSADNVLDGGAGNDMLIGEAGNDQLLGGAGDDYMLGGAGNDFYRIGSAGDQVIELPGDGIDTIEAHLSYTLGSNNTIENLTLAGSALAGQGNALNNVLTGNAQDNVLDGDAGADTMVGGAGNDVYHVDNAGDVVNEAAGNGIDTVYSQVSLTLRAHVDNLTLLGSGHHDGFGNADANVLVGNAGNNRLDGGAGNDTLSGGAGNDSLLGNAGDDVMAGGLGNDFYRVGSAGDHVVEESDAGTDEVEAHVNYTLGAHLERLVLRGTALQGTGNALDNALFGNERNNVLQGGDGADSLAGGLGADTLIGGAGGDVYQFGRNEGVDTVQESDSTPGVLDTMEVLGNVAADQIWFRQLGNDLEVSIIGTLDRALIKDWYVGSQHRIEQFRTETGRVLLDTAVDNLVTAMASFAPPVAGQNTLPDNYQTSLSAVIAANWS